MKSFILISGKKIVNIHEVKEITGIQTIKCYQYKRRNKSELNFKFIEIIITQIFFYQILKSYFDLKIGKIQL